MLSKSSKWELSFVHYIAKFTISRFVIVSRFSYFKYNTMANHTLSGINCHFIKYKPLIFEESSPMNKIF